MTFFDGLGRKSGRNAGGAVLVALSVLSGCAYVPGVALPGSGTDDTRRMVENRVWLDVGEDAPQGSLRAFLTDGTMMMTSCVETYRLSPWRWVSGATLVWEEDGKSIRGEVALVGRDEMVLVLDLDGQSFSRRFKAAAAPVVCPDLPR